MKVNLRSIASTIVRFSANRLKVRYFTATIPNIDGQMEPVLVTLAAKTIWGVILLQAHWFNDLQEQLGIEEITPQTDEDTLVALLDAFDTVLFQGYGITVSGASYGYGAVQETIDVVPLTNYLD